MSLVKKIFTLSLAVGLSFSAMNKSQGQTPLASISNSLELNVENFKGIPKPLEKPLLYMDVHAKTRITPYINIGEVELRENNLYANLLFGTYQIMFEKVNDSTFVEHLYSRSLLRSSERYEVFTTNLRTDSLGSSYFVLSDYTVLIGDPREEKIPLKDKVFSPKHLPAIVALNKFLGGNLNKDISVLVLGVEYDFNLYEERKILSDNIYGTKSEINTFAKMSDVVKTPDDSFLMEEYVNLVSIEERKKSPNNTSVIVHPQSFEGRFTVVNSGIWNGKYGARGVVKK